MLEPAHGRTGPEVSSVVPRADLRRAREIVRVFGLDALEHEHQRGRTEHVVAHRVDERAEERRRAEERDELRQPATGARWLVCRAGVARAAIERALHELVPERETAALFAAVPLMLGWGEGAELRRPLGLSIFGGLIVSQMLTLYTTPVIYLMMERLRQRFGGTAAPAPHPAE